MRAFLIFSILAGLGLANNVAVAQVATREAKQPATNAQTSSSPPLALPPPGDFNRTSTTGGSVGGIGSIMNTLGALALVVGVFLLIVWLMKRGGGTEATTQNAIVQLVAKTQLGGGQSASVLRFGNQLVLIAQSTNQSQTLATITDPDEVERLCSLCTTEPVGASTGAAALSNVISSFMNRSHSPAGSSTAGESA